MQHRLLQWLACPACENDDLVLETTKTATEHSFPSSWEEGEQDLPGISEDGTERTEILEGALHCSECARVYLIQGGIPRMVLDGTDPTPASGHRWTRFDGTIPEYEDNFKDMSHPLEPESYLGKLVLDAGCGFGRHAFFAARYGAEVIAMDVAADAVASARENTQHLQRVHVIQGDVHRPPLRRAAMDLVYSFGVLHHLPEPKAAFKSLSTLVRPGGQLQVWAYGPRAGSAAVVSGALRGAAANMDDDNLHRLSSGLATTLRLFSHTPYRFMRHIPGGRSVVSHLPAHDHHKWPFEVVVADIYDRLRIPVLHTIPGEDLETWFVDQGFLDIKVTRRVRNSESFRGIGTRR